MGRKQFLIIKTLWCVGNQLKIMEKNLDTKWNQVARKALLGKTIVAVNYMSPENAKDMYWNKRPIMFELSDGSVCFISADDEGNDGGALFMQDKDGKDITLPVLSL